MYQLQATIRDYDPVTDTATVELTAIGSLEAWISGIKPVDGLPRAYLSYGYIATLLVPDAHRLCEAKIVAVHPSNTVVSSVGTATQKTQTGRVAVATGAAGSGSASPVFPTAFSAAPTVYVSADKGTASLSSVSSSGFTVTINGAATNSQAFVSWSATGNA